MRYLLIGGTHNNELEDLDDENLPAVLELPVKEQIIFFKPIKTSFLTEVYTRRTLIINHEPVIVYGHITLTDEQVFRREK